MSRAAVIALYALLVLIWSSTWVAIKIGLEDCPPLLGAGARFASAGLVLLGVTLVRRRSLRTDARLAGILALLPFAFAYGLVYWGEQHIPSGLAAVLFGVLPLYTALIGGALLPDEPMHPRLFAGVLVAIAGLALAFVESLDLGSDDLAWAGALALLLSPLGASVGNVAIKLRAARLDAVVLNGWAMLGGGAAAADRVRGHRELGRVRLDRRVARVDRVPVDRGLGDRVRDPHGAAAPGERARDVVPRDAAAVRRARVRRGALRRAGHRACGARAPGWWPRA